MTYKKSHLYEVVFWDHAEGIAQPIKIKYTGYFITEGDNYLNFSSWHVLSKDQELVENNYTHTIIIKDCIIDVYEIHGAE